MSFRDCYCLLWLRRWRLSWRVSDQLLPNCIWESVYSSTSRSILPVLLKVCYVRFDMSIGILPTFMDMKLFVVPRPTHRRFVDASAKRYAMARSVTKDAYLRMENLVT